MGAQLWGVGEAKDSDILLGRDSYLLEPTEWPPGSQASCGVGERYSLLVGFALMLAFDFLMG